MRGRPKKAPLNAVVYVHAPRHGLPFYGVVVDYVNDRKWGRYIIVETDWRGASPRGPAREHEPSEFTNTGRTSKPPGRYYRAWKRDGGLEMLGCSCLCGSPHIHGFEPEPDE